MVVYELRPPARKRYGAASVQCFEGEYEGNDGESVLIGIGIGANKTTWGVRERDRYIYINTTISDSVLFHDPEKAAARLVAAKLESRNISIAPGASKSLGL